MVRPKVITEDIRQEITTLQAFHQMTIKLICQRVGISRQTYYRALKSGQLSQKKFLDPKR